MKKEAPVSVGSSDIVLLSTLDVNGLHEFTRAAWSTSFLPTLYDSLACASKPWDLPGDGSDMVKFIQEILDSVYPGTGYRVKLNDQIFSMVHEFYFEFQSYLLIVNTLLGTRSYQRKMHVFRSSIYQDCYRFFRHRALCQQAKSNREVR